MHPPRRVALVAVILTATAALTGCGGSASPTSAGTSAAATGETAGRYTTPLADVCPKTVSIQLPWWPESEYAWAFQLIGANGTADASTYRYTGPLGSTGVNLEIRSGGPAIGGELPLASLYKDDSVLLGVTTTEDSVGSSVDYPSVSVLTYEQKTPLVFFWGNDSWDFTTVEDIKKSGQTLLAFDGAPYLDVLVAEGLLDKKQIDGSYDGTPARFVAENGNVVAQGLITSEVYAYQHDISQWGKPVHYVEVGNEYKAYHSQVSVRADKLDANRACLKKLVPLLQQASVDYWHAPAATNQVLLDVVKKYNGSWTLTAGVTDWAAKIAVEKKIVANGPDGTFGSFDLDRVNTFISQVAPVLTKDGKKVKPGLSASDIVTNEFLDPSVKL